jgi:NitT/TauT family transport system ATP-binding protein
MVLSNKVEIDHLSKAYWVDRDDQSIQAFLDVTLHIREGEFMALLGPSGCGKSSLLNVLAGLIPFDAGTATIDGRTVDRPGVDRAVVFQQPSLLPWRTIFGNIRYGMEMQQRFDEATMQARTRQFAQLVGLAGFGNSYPGELSGGMQQRVNLARALAVDPEVLLMDEPFAALDAQTREFMQEELLRIWVETGKTVLFITHQISEAVCLADRVAVMSARPGRIKAVFDVPFKRPRTLSLKRLPAFLDLEDRIWAHIEEESERMRRAPISAAKA